MTYKTGWKFYMLKMYFLENYLSLSLRERQTGNLQITPVSHLNVSLLVIALRESSSPGEGSRGPTDDWSSYSGDLVLTKLREGLKGFLLLLPTVLLPKEPFM